MSGNNPQVSAAELATLLDRAREMGLHIIADKFSEDIEIAGNVAKKLKTNFKAAEDLTIDPWPAMTAKEQ